MSQSDISFTHSVKSEKVHGSTELKILLDETNNPATTGLKAEDTIQTKEFKCKRCGEVFPSLKLKLKHLHSVHRLKQKVECQVCKKIISSRNTFLKHVKVHTGESRGSQASCPICNKAVGSRSMKRHLMVHTGERPYKCEICTKSFCTSSEMKMHKLRHGKPKKFFSCTDCKETFQFLSELNRHKKIHADESSERCEICLKIFESAVDLLVHHSVHHTFRCEVCSHVLLTKQDLISHQATHVDGKLYKCDSCSRTFPTEMQLKEHILVALHSAQKAFVCKICGHSARKILFLNRHYKMQHNI